MQQTDLLDQTSDDVIASGESNISVQEARDLVKLFAEKGDRKKGTFIFLLDA